MVAVRGSPRRSEVETGRGGGRIAPAKRNGSRRRRGGPALATTAPQAPVADWTRAELAKAFTPNARFCARPISVHPVKNPEDQLVVYKELHAYTRKVHSLMGT